jgi:putative transposase
MPKSYTNLLYHIVFSTHDRRPLITPDRRPELYEYIGGTVRGLGGISLAIGGIEDHLHLLAKLRPDKAPSDLLRDLKSNSSGWMHDMFPDAKDFAWQHGYGRLPLTPRKSRRYPITLQTKSDIIRSARSATSSSRCFASIGSSLMRSFSGRSHRTGK